MPDEIVVVDNGSTDDTAAVAREFGARVVTEPIPGIPRASSAGYDAATGDLIARIDADSVCPPEWLERVAAAFETEPGLSVLTGMGEFYGSTPLVHWLGRKFYLGGMYWSMTPFLAHPPIFGSNFVMRREVWTELRTEVHREQRNIHDDLDLSLHIKPWMTRQLRPDLTVRRLGTAVRRLERIPSPAQLGPPDRAQSLAGRLPLATPPGAQALGRASGPRRGVSVTAHADAYSASRSRPSWCGDRLARQWPVSYTASRAPIRSAKSAW